MIKNNITEQEDPAPVHTMSLTKSRRDEFLVEIRKGKREQLDLPNKRRNLLENFTNKQKETTEFELPPEKAAKLKELHGQFFDYLEKGDFEDLVEVIRSLREWLTDQGRPLPSAPAEIIELIPHSLNLLSEGFSKYKSLHKEVTWFLANISAGSSKDTQILVESDAILVLARTFKASVHEETQENVNICDFHEVDLLKIMWCLANIAGEGNLDYRNQILDYGILDMVTREIFKTPKKVLYSRTAVWFISNVVKIKPCLRFEQAQNLFPLLANLLHHDDRYIKEYVLDGLAALTEEVQEAHIKEISEWSLSPRIVKLMNPDEERIAINAMKTIGNLVKLKGGLELDFNNSQLFEALSKTMNSRNKELKGQSCILLFNILSDEKFDDHKSLDDYEIFEILIKFARMEQNEIETQAVLCLKKYVETASQEFIISAIEEGVLDIFFRNLHEEDVKVIENSLRGLHKLLEFGENEKDKHAGKNLIFTKIDKCELKKSIESLVSLANENIVHEAEIILSNFFTKDS